MKCLRLTLPASLTFVSALAAVPAPPSFEREVVPVLRKYCYECHDADIHKAGLTLDAFKTAADVRGARKHFESVLRAVTRHEMPPDDAAAFPTHAERETIAQFIESELFQLDPAHPDPGRATLRRLNRAEYDNAIRDLVGVDFQPAADFPADDSGYGFDNIGDVLSLPPVLMEKYLAAADKVLDQAIVTDPIRSRTVRVPASLAQIGFNAVGDRGDGWVQLISLEEDDVAVELPVTVAGDYLVRFQAYATKVGGALVGQGNEKPIEFKEDPGPTKIWVALDDAFAREFTVTTDEKNPGIYEARLGVPAGRHSFRAVMRRQRYGANELTMLNGRLGKQQPGIVYVKWLEIEGPLPAAAHRPNLGAPRVLRQNGEVETTLTLVRETEVILRAQAYADQAGTEPVRMEFRIDGRPVQTFDVHAPGRMAPIAKQRVFSLQLLVPQPEVYETRVTLPAGTHRFSAALTNAFSDPTAENPNLRERRLVLQHLEWTDLASPVATPPLPEPLRALFDRHNTTDRAAAARGVIGDFARRAWRRPVTGGELDKLVRLYALARDQGDTFEGGVKLALKAALVSPHFLFIGAPPVTPAVAASRGTKAMPIDDLTLASRLSFFVWSSGPDEELLALAERGELRLQLEPQVRRLLASPKAQALVANFASQWLEIRALGNAQPDRKLFPDFDPGLRTAMQRETELFFEHVMREDRSVLDFLRGDYTFANARLAKFYGLPPLTGEEFQKISLAGLPRRGVLTHGSVLTLTSNPSRTSPVKRGKWILENLLGTPPPPPPPNIPELDDKERRLTGTLRQQMQQHSTNATCASCHARMDPIGFGLEGFNAIGAWREQDGDAPIDSSGKLASGETFAGAAELADLLARKRADDFRRCLAEKMLTYALGRGVEFHDRPAVEKIGATLRDHGDTFSTLMLAVAQSLPFLNRRAEP